MPESIKSGLQLILPVIALNVANGVAFCDLLGISAIIPTVSLHFGSIGAIEWATTSQLIGATVGQCVLGYLSDVFSRRDMLIFGLVLLFASTMATIFSFRLASPILFVVLRAFSGIAVGSISSLVNIAQSDIATKQQRLKLQGIQGTSVAIGSILGMMVGAVFVQQNRAHHLYSVEAGLTALALALIACFVKPHRQRPSWKDLRDVLKDVDYAGILSGTGFIVPGLIIISKYDRLAKSIIAALGALTGVCLATFVYVALKKPFKSRPIVPFWLFRNHTLSAIYTQNLLFGAAYYTFIYFFPIYLMTVRQCKALEAASMMIAYFVCHGFWSAASAQVILWLQRRGRKSYSTVILQGFICWAGAVSVIAGGAYSTHHEPIVVTILMAATIGFGTGACFQNSVLAIREQVTDETNAVALGVRNVLRYLGGAVGTAVSGIIMRSVLKKNIPENLMQYRKHTISSKELDDIPNEADRNVVRSGFSKGITWVFVSSAALLAICIFLCIFLKEAPSDEESKKETLELVESPSSTASGENVDVVHGDAHQV